MAQKKRCSTTSAAKIEKNDEYNKFFLKKFGIIRNSTYVPFGNKRIPHTIVRGIFLMTQRCLPPLDESVWLSQAQMADLFGTKRQAITKHLLNIYECKELKKEATSSILELVRKEGNRIVKRKVEFYNLDAIISVGYRVKSLNGTRFRRWANSVLKQYYHRRVTGHFVTCASGQFSQQIPRFGQRADVCPYKLEKK